MPKFQKRHYESIADVIADAGLEKLNAIGIGMRFADMLAKDNPRFNRERFLRACQWQPNRLAAERPDWKAAARAFSGNGALVE